MPHHSILIPYRNRPERLSMCLWSILRSAAVCDEDDFEVVISDQGSDQNETVDAIVEGLKNDLFVKFPKNIRIIWDTDPLSCVLTEQGTFPVFSKVRAINRAIEAARGDIFTFLDVDALVGRYFMRAAPNFLRPKSKLTRLCYRAVYLPEASAFIGYAYDEAELLEKYNDEYVFQRAHEAYWSPECNAYPAHSDPKDPESPLILEGNHIFGNSQFSIRREDLGDVRCDERMIGAGWEDIDFIYSIWNHLGDRYLARILIQPDNAMWHIRSVREPGWDNPEANTRNRQLAIKKWDIIPPGLSIGGVS